MKEISVRVGLEDYRKQCWKRLCECERNFGWATEKAEAVMDTLIDEFADYNIPFLPVMDFVDNLIVNGVN
jgi:hypothetical protein